MNTIAALILTYNEENHIARCICSLENVCEEVWVLDSYSTDRTCEIAESMGAKVCQHAFENYSKQFNWGLQNLPVAADWIWRIDADEFLEGNIGQAVRDELAHCADWSL